MQTHHLKKVIAITGVIGSGKSTVSGELVKKGKKVICADQLAREIFSRDFSGYASLISDLTKQLLPRYQEKFPDFARVNEFVSIENGVNRPEMARLVFSDPESLRILNSITHPKIQSLFQEKLAECDDSIVFYDVPLLFETDLHTKTWRNVVVYAPEPVCIARASQRLGVPAGEIQARLASQISIEKKKLLADYVIDNSGSLEHLDKELERFSEYIEKLGSEV